MTKLTWFNILELGKKIGKEITKKYFFKLIYLFIRDTNSIISNVITIQHERSVFTCLVLYVEVRQDGATVANKTKIRFKK